MITTTKKNPWENLLKHPDHDLNIEGINILVKDKVFTPNPKITYSTTQILKHIPFLENKEILDMGCGTGIIGIYCLKKGVKHVVFTDIEEVALINTKINLKKNNIQSKYDILHSNLFEKITKKFDYVFANLPILDEVWNSKAITNNILRFLENCKNYIKPGGKIYLSWASFADIQPLIKTLKKLNYNYKIIEEDKINYKWYLIVISS